MFLTTHLLTYAHCDTCTQCHSVHMSWWIKQLLTYLAGGAKRLGRETSRGELTKGRNVPKSRCGLCGVSWHRLPSQRGRRTHCHVTSNLQCDQQTSSVTEAPWQRVATTLHIQKHCLLPLCAYFSIYLFTNRQHVSDVTWTPHRTSKRPTADAGKGRMSNRSNSDELGSERQRPARFAVCGR